MATNIAPEDLARRKRINKVLIPVVGVLALSVLLLTCVVGNDDEKKEEKGMAIEAPKEATLKDKTIEACGVSHQFVEERLKAPSTADFQNCYQAAVAYRSDSMFTVQSYVDAQNAFGAPLRTKYTCIMKYKGGNDWQLLNLTLHE